MQQTIDGKSYNTATAFEIATFSDGRRRGDPLHVSDVLYRGPGGLLGSCTADAAALRASCP